MSLEKDRGIVISTLDLTAGDTIIRIVPEQKTTNRFILHGIKKTKRRNPVATELGTLVCIDYYPSTSDIANVKEISVTERFEEVKKSYRGFTTVTYFCEILDSMMPGTEPAMESFKFFMGVLKSLAHNGIESTVSPLFKAKVLKLTGLMTEKLECQNCNASIGEMMSAEVYPDSFEILCGNCKNLTQNNIQEIRILSEMIRFSYAEFKTLGRDKKLIAIIDRYLNIYLYRLLGKKLKSEKIFYESLENS